MNERIKLLKEQAMEWVPNMADPDTKIWLLNAEKFALLIVKECSKVIVNGGYRNPALGEKHPLTPLEIATMIKEHFGVEE
jgi:hypothetical protein